MQDSMPCASVVCPAVISTSTFPAAVLFSSTTNQVVLQSAVSRTKKIQCCAKHVGTQFRFQDRSFRNTEQTWLRTKLVDGKSTEGGTCLCEARNMKLVQIWTFHLSSLVCHLWRYSSETASLSHAGGADFVASHRASLISYVVRNWMVGHSVFIGGVGVGRGAYLPSC
jgi:hypothetical protein